MSAKTRKKKECRCNSCTSERTGKDMKQLRVAICFFGQPRRAAEGFETFKKLMNQSYHSNVTFDIFFHTWVKHENPGGKISYTTSLFRNLRKKDTDVDADIIDKLVSMYKPKSFDVNTPIEFQKDLYEDTLIYRRTNEYGKENANNNLSQQFSRQRVRDLLQSYIKATGIHYDFVLGSRFDYLNKIDINFNVLEPAYLHVASYRKPRRSIPDALVISNQSMFLKVFNVFNNFTKIANNKRLADHFTTVCKRELFILHPEELLHINYIYYYKDNSLIEYHDEIPNFHK